MLYAPHYERQVLGIEKVHDPKAKVCVETVTHTHTHFVFRQTRTQSTKVGVEGERGTHTHTLIQPDWNTKHLHLVLQAVMMGIDLERVDTSVVTALKCPP